MSYHLDFSRTTALLLTAAGLTVAGCAAPPPAPIISRTTPGGQPQRPAVPPPAAVTPAPAVPPAATAPAVPPAPVDAPVVQTAPIRSGDIEARSIDGRPLPSTAGTPPAGAAPPAAALPPNTRTQPRGVKAPYSDAALAELRAADAAPSSAGAPGPGSAQPGALPGAAAGTAPGAVPGTTGAAPAPRAEAPAAASGAADGEGPWSWPTSGRVIQSFEQSASRGIALDGKLGDPVHAAADGRVIFSGPGPRGYGNLVIVKHDNDLLSVYAHNSTLAVKEGQTVRRGQRIAEIGDSGASSARLHFEIRQQGRPVDPMKFLPRR